MQRRRKNILMFAVITTLAFLTEAAVAERYEILTGDGSEVIFESKAPLDSFKGRTRSVRGWFEVDLNDPTGPVSLEVVVDLATFDTGKSKRNQHMRENHLETDLYPQTVFRAGTVTSVHTDNERTVFSLTGELDLHGVVRPVNYEVNLQRRTDGSITIDTQFVVKLSDHNIKRPRFLVMKLADEQKVKVVLEARSAIGGEQND